MNTDVPNPDPSSGRLRITVEPAPGVKVLPSDDPAAATVQVPVASVPLTQLLKEQKQAANSIPTGNAPTPAAVAAEDLPNDPILLKQMIRELLDLLAKKDHEAEHYRHKLDQLLRKMFGPRAEKFNPDQPWLFGDMAQETGDAPPPPAAESEAAEPPAKRRGHGRNALPPNLRREKHLYELAEKDRQCPHCHVACQQFGTDTSTQLDYVPASVFAHEHTHCKYACPKCHDYVIVADKPAQPIAKGLPGAGLLAQVVVSKYADHLPLHRLERIFARHGITLSRSTMCDWMKRCAGLLQPLYDTLVSQVLASKVLHTDDTKVPHQDPESPGKTKSARMWTYVGDEVHPYNVFDFTLDWSRDGPRDFLADFKNFLQADGLTGYDTLAEQRKIQRAGCWAHARRHFYDARDSDPARAAEAMARIRRLYAVEDEAKALIAKEALTGAVAEAVRLRLRQEKSLVELTSLRQWLDQEQAKVLPKSPIGQAIGYALNQWPALQLYVQHGFLDIDNNAAERALRPIAVGRNNWLFVGSATGGQTAAVLFTITSTCHRLKIDPFAYLRDVLGRLAAGPLSPEELAQLLPDRWTPPTPAATSIP
jgi:transposase